MRSPDRRLVVRRRRQLALLLALTSLLGLGPGPRVAAQDAEGGSGPTGEELFGVYQLEARGVGVQGRYELEGILPGGAPLLDLTLPETATRFSNGPLGYGLAGLAYPGPLLADLGVLMAQTGAGSEDSVPPWPIKAEAFYPTGPTEVDESQGPAVQRVRSGDLGVQAEGIFPEVAAAPLIEVGSISAASRSSIEGELAVSRTRIELGDISILTGLVTIDTLVTDLVAAHDGQGGSTSGGTVASGVRLLGLAAELDGDGLRLAESPSDDPAGGPLGALGAPLGEALGPVQEALAPVLDQVRPQVDDLLAQAGLTISIMEPTEEQADSGAATRISSGLSLRFRYEGKAQTELRQLIDAIPPELRPSLGPVPNPITFLVENHVQELNLAPGTVTALASPPFPTFEGPALPPLPPVDVPPLGGAPSLGDPGFATPVAPLPPGGSSPGGGGSGVPVEPVANALDGAVPAILVALALVASPLFGLGSSRLADNVLAASSAACPFGLDEPPSPGRPA
ncbi:MAG: choice-of-anchor P family protein [Actinomycetota bacterium]